jgi:hypothetical protein
MINAIVKSLINTPEDWTVNAGTDYTQASFSHSSGKVFIGFHGRKLNVPEYKEIVITIQKENPNAVPQTNYQPPIFSNVAAIPVPNNNMPIIHILNMADEDEKRILTATASKFISEVVEAKRKEFREEVIKILK